MSRTAGPTAAEALAARPGYFRTLGGFGCDDRRGTYQAEGDRPSGVAWLLGHFLGPLTACTRPEGRVSPRSLACDDLFKCAEAGDVAGVEKWIQRGGGSGQDTDALGWTPLHYAARFDRPRVCELLLRSVESSRCLVDTPELSGCSWTPLQWASQMGHAECAHVLLEGGAAPNGVGLGKAPIRLAGYSGHEEVVQVLLGFGAAPQGWASDEVADACWARFSWRRRRVVFLIRDKAGVGEGPEAELRALLTKWPSVLRIVVGFL